jgi:hypothetical protein
MTDTVIPQNIDLSSWDILYLISQTAWGSPRLCILLYSPAAALCPAYC